jgi:hypothetical protein
MPRRIYIYRRGTTDNCAVTADRGYAHLPPTLAADHWRFWMQIGPLQAQGGRCGFDIRAAVHAITTQGYHLFTGSTALLGQRTCASSKAGSEEGQSNA